MKVQNCLSPGMFAFILSVKSTKKIISTWIFQKNILCVVIFLQSDGSAPWKYQKNIKNRHIFLTERVCGGLPPVAMSCFAPAAVVYQPCKNGDVWSTWLDTVSPCVKQALLFYACPVITSVPLYVRSFAYRVTHPHGCLANELSFQCIMGFGVIHWEGTKLLACVKGRRGSRVH